MSQSPFPNSIIQTLPSILPVLPLRGTVAFPLALLPLAVGQTRSVKLVDDVMRDNRLVMLVSQKDEQVELATFDDIYKIGTIAIIHRLIRADDGALRLVVQGIERARILDLIKSEPYLVANVESMAENPETTVESEALRRAVLSLLGRLAGLVEEVSDELLQTTQSLSDLRHLTYLVALAVPFTTTVRQELLEINPLDAKLRRLVELLQHEVTIRELGRKILSDTQERLSKTQKEYFLREQVRSIQQELGEGAEQLDISDLKKRISEVALSLEARKEAERELNRLATIPTASPEHGMIRSYLDWMLNLPWNTSSGTDINVHKARTVLDEDHYDLDKIKTRIVEHLAVRQLRQQRQIINPPVQDGNVAPETAHEPILCFVGPPGVGKTSLGQSIARALNRKFVRIALGGVQDEAEIRGHRRTYIGAMPGRIIQSLKRAGTKDAVFMLDEIDKVSSSWRGDPSAALLEVLDPAQNQNFVDNYLGVAFDLSQVMFIATANTLDTVPAPLLDRMEVLRLAGYTDEEKIHIAQHYLVPNQIKAHGLKVTEAILDKAALLHIIRGYTREAGVRNLDREIAAVCRKVVYELVKGKVPVSAMNAAVIEGYLGRVHFVDETAERTTRPGVATGLAWTPVGGDVLFVEATFMPSRNEKMILTGMLGDVMRESAQAALSYVRSNAQALNLDASILEGKAVHLHVPAGATPKDGPSAGVTMLTALVSLLSGRLVQSHTAMTGEITLRGKVLPVGGIKEKVLAAHRAGIKIIILPKHNEKDLDEVPEELRQALQFHLVDTVEAAVAYALEPKTQSF